MDLTAVAQRVEALVEPLVERAELELFGVQYRSERGHMALRVIADRPEGGVTLDELAALSRQLGDVLDVHEAVPGRYHLECTSPGVERPLLRPRHFRLAIGQRVRLTTAADEDGRRRWRGVLTAADDDHVSLLDDEVGPRDFPLDAIAEARTEFDATRELAEHRRR
jgi:ribosome maturation factor RimP